MRISMYHWASASVFCNLELEKSQNLMKNCFHVSDFLCDDSFDSRLTNFSGNFSGEFWFHLDFKLLANWKPKLQIEEDKHLVLNKKNFKNFESHSSLTQNSACKTKI